MLRDFEIEISPQRASSSGHNHPWHCAWMFPTNASCKAMNLLTVVWPARFGDFMALVPSHERTAACIISLYERSPNLFQSVLYRTALHSTVDTLRAAEGRFRRKIGSRMFCGWLFTTRRNCQETWPCCGRMDLRNFFQEKSFPYRMTSVNENCNQSGSFKSRYIFPESDRVVLLLLLRQAFVRPWDMDLSTKA